MTQVINLDQLTLYTGSHAGGPPPGHPDCKMCFWEVANAIRGPLGRPAGPISETSDDENDYGDDDWDGTIELTDACPPDVSRVLHATLLRLNDRLGDDRRQTLKRYLPDPTTGADPLAGTRDDHDTTRRYLAVDWSIRTAVPMLLDHAGHTDPATQLRALAPIVDQDSADTAYAALRPIGDAMWTARRETLARIREQVKAKLTEQGRPAADAVAVAVADADAVAVAVADAAAVAVAVAVAAAAAAADAAAAAAAAAAAVAAAVAAAAAGDYWSIREAAYSAARKVAEERISERMAPVLDQLHASALDLLDRMIRPTPAT